MKTSEQINEIAKALAAFQAEVKQPEKDGINPHFKNRYVTLDNTLRTIHEYAPKHGLSFVQMPVSAESGVGCVTTIFHESGQFIEFDPFILPMDKRTPQGAGSALTYSKRYSLQSAFGLGSDEDDDANIAEQHTNGNGQSTRPATEKQLNYVNKLLQKKVNENWPYERLYELLKEQIGTTNEMENWTADEASKAIKILQQNGKNGEQ